MKADVTPRCKNGRRDVPLSGCTVTDCSNSASFLFPFSDLTMPIASRHPCHPAFPALIGMPGARGTLFSTGSAMMPRTSEDAGGHTGTDGNAGRADPDLALVLRAGKGDHQAASLLVGRHLRRITLYAFRMLRDGAEAEDVAQETFLRAWQSAPNWRSGEAKFETWLYRVAGNLCLDRLRRRKRWSDEAPPERVDPAEGPAGQLLARQRRDRVAEAVAQLPERQREALILCHYQEMSNNDAAAVMSVSVDALESLLARARRGLRGTLADLGRDLYGEEPHHAE